jgi:hypothetical protein
MPADGLEVGDRVNVDTCEGFGGEGVIVAERDSDTCRFKVRLDGGKGEPFWAHDFELSPLGPPKEGYDSRPDTRKHIGEVRRLLSKVVDDFVRRQREHDASKLVSPEVEAFDEFTPKLRDSTYGSPEYEGFRKAMGEALAHHYAHNSHHPEHAYRDERWLPVCGYEGLYDVSTEGRVRNGLRGTMLSLQPTPKGYLRVSLSRVGVSRNHMVHRLVARAFVSNDSDKPEVNHKDGDKVNNRATNLEWVTESENLIHAYDTGLRGSTFKYFVHCVELDVYTPGTQAMERVLRGRGYDRVTAAGIWRAMDREGKHYDLTFVGYPIKGGHPQSMLRGMNLFDVLEMLCDWLAATKRHADGDIRKSVEINQERFGYGDELKRILLNTLPLLEG